MDSKISLNLIKHWQALCNDIVFTDIAPNLLQNKIITVSEYQHITSQLESAKTENLLLVLLRKNENVLMKFAQSLQRDYVWLAEKIKEGCGQDDGRDEVDATPITQTDARQAFENDTTTEDEKGLEEDMCIDCNNLNPINRNHQLNNRINIKNGKLDRRRINKSRVKNRLRPKIQNSDVSLTKEIIKPELNEEVTDEAIKMVKNCSLASKSWTTIAHSLGLTDRVHDIRFKVILHGEDLNMCVVYLLKNWLEMFPKIATLSKLIEVLRSENFNRVADQLTELLYRKPA